MLVENKKELERKTHIKSQVPKITLNTDTPDQEVNLKILFGERSLAEAELEVWY